MVGVEDLSLVDVARAEECAHRAHTGQKWAQSVRGFREDYMRHIASVRYEVYRGLFRENGARLNYATVLALLHDVIEDCDSHWMATIAACFGNAVLDDVLALTKDEKLPLEQQMLDSLRRILERGTPEVALVKIADRIVNLSVPPHQWRLPKLKAYLEESRLIERMLCGVYEQTKVVDERLRGRIKRYERHIEAREEERKHRDFVKVSEPIIEVELVCEGCGFTVCSGRRS